MKREEILFYLSNGLVHLYFKNTKKEVIFDVDTSSFFKFGEISDVEKFQEEIEKIAEKTFSGSILKPIVHVLYNDITYSDQKYLYKVGLSSFNYSNIKFYELSGLIRKIDKNKNILIFDKDYYTDIKNRCKLKNIDELENDPIIIGENDGKCTHFSDKNLIWNEFKYYTSDV